MFMGNGKSPKNPLPLSWARSANGGMQFNSVQLRFSRRRWFYAADLSASFSLHNDCPEIFNHHAPVFLRGCPADLAESLAKSGWQTLPIGSEALLNVQGNHFKKRSLRALIRRGNRWGAAREMAMDSATAKNFADLQHHSRHSSEPQLRYLFRDDFRECQRCFAFVGEKEHWLGSVLLTQNTPGYWHTEMILRARKAPVGIMEALIEHIFVTLQREKQRFLSLGEVPFYHGTPLTDKKARLIARAGKSLKFAYNYAGLFRFKNKFAPIWQPLFLCSKSRITFPMLLDVFIQSRYAHLVVYRLRGLLKNEKCCN